MGGSSKVDPETAYAWPDVGRSEKNFEELPEDRFQSPPMAYTIQAGYEKMIEGFGGKGYAVRTPDELATSLKQALEDSMPSIINVHIDPRARAKPQKHHWLTA